MVIHLAKHLRNIGVIIFFRKNWCQIPNDDPPSWTTLTTCGKSSTFWVNIDWKYGLFVYNKKEYVLSTCHWQLAFAKFFTLQLLTCHLPTFMVHPQRFQNNHNCNTQTATNDTFLRPQLKPITHTFKKRWENRKQGSCVQLALTLLKCLFWFWIIVRHLHYRRRKILRFDV